VCMCLWAVTVLVAGGAGGSGHRGAVRGLALDRFRLVSASADNTLKVIVNQ
jgi:hypothetical protein